MLWAHLRISFRDMHNPFCGPRAVIIYICMFIPLGLGTCVMPLWNVRDGFFIWVQDTHSTVRIFWLFCVVNAIWAKTVWGPRAGIYTYVCLFPWDWTYAWCHYEMSEMLLSFGSRTRTPRPTCFDCFVLLVHSGHMCRSPEEISTILFGVRAQVLYTYVCLFSWDWEDARCHYAASEMVFFHLGPGHALHAPHT